jgi:1-deoxy-D-xylulose-5-phosphate reductoisomerase
MTAGVASSARPGRSGLRRCGCSAPQRTVSSRGAHRVRQRPAAAQQAREWKPSYRRPGRRNGSEADNGWHTGERVSGRGRGASGRQHRAQRGGGRRGLDATLAALRAGKRVALANKETLVLGGELVMARAAAGGGELIPVDSEHSAILQCIAGRPRGRAADRAHGVRRPVPRTAGERARARDSRGRAPPSHLEMGRKITVDSATLANKALEVIEAHFLFGLPYDRIEVVVHPQSVVHSFVSSWTAACWRSSESRAWSCRCSTHLRTLNGWTRGDPVRPRGALAAHIRARGARRISRRCGSASQPGRAGGAAPAVFNAANEQAVHSFSMENHIPRHSRRDRLRARGAARTCPRLRRSSSSLRTRQRAVTSCRSAGRDSFAFRQPLTATRICWHGSLRCSSSGS